MKTINLTVPKANAYVELYAYLLELRQRYEKIITETYVLKDAIVFRGRLDVVEDMLDKMQQFLSIEKEKMEHESLSGL